MKLWKNWFKDEVGIQRKLIATVNNLNEALKILYDIDFEFADVKDEIQDSHSHWFAAIPTEGSWQVPVTVFVGTGDEDFCLVNWAEAKLW